MRFGIALPAYSTCSFFMTLIKGKMPLSIEQAKEIWWISTLILSADFFSSLLIISNLSKTGLKTFPPTDSATLDTLLHIFQKGLPVLKSYKKNKWILFSLKYLNSRFFLSSINKTVMILHSW